MNNYPALSTPLKYGRLFSQLISCLIIASTLSGRDFGSSGVETSEITVEGTRFLLDGQPFPYTGVSFFNAIYNPSFNESSVTRREWMRKFKSYGINVFRVWAQWDNARKFVDTSNTATLYREDGSLRDEHVATLQSICRDADEEGMVIQLVLYTYESVEAERFPIEGDEIELTRNVARDLLPYRNLVFQIWNEHDHRTLEHLEAIKSIDPDRLVSTSPGWAGYLGHARENGKLDFLTPHTTRQGGAKRTWEVAPLEVAYLLKRYGVPVVDDEPARNGTAKFGGPAGAATSPYDHIIQIQKVWEKGGYVCYHHDMFQLGYGDPSIPPSGIPDPEFSPYHSEVFKFLKMRDRYIDPSYTSMPLE